MATIFDALVSADSLIEELDDIVTSARTDAAKVEAIDALIEDYRKD